MEPTVRIPRPTTPENINKIPIAITPIKAKELYEDLSACPATPPPAPASIQPQPLRYPETLGIIIEVRESEGKGKGVFAIVDIPAGTILLSESPLVTLIDTGTRADPLDAAVAALSPIQRASFLSLSHYSRNPNESVHRSIVYSNGYSIMNDLATGLFETASRINHSCVPNSQYVWKPNVGRMIFWNRFKLMKDEEVCVDYGHKPNYLKRIYGFECQCGGCTERGTELGSSSSEASEDGGRDVMGIAAVLETFKEEDSKGMEG